MDFIFLKLRELFWNVWLHSVALEAVHILEFVYMECKKNFIL